jgi:hypothetical protein
LCGALASNQLQWDGDSLIALGLVVILVEFAWGSLWDLVTSTAWFGLVSDNWVPTRSKLVFALPYTLPQSPGGRIAHSVEWLRDRFWPAFGSSVLGLAAAAGLALVISLLLDAPIRLPTAALVALLGVAMVWRKHGRTPLAVQALVQVGLSWMVGHLVFAEQTVASWALALAFSVAAWGAYRASNRLSFGLVLLNGGLTISILIAFIMREPLAAGLMAILLLGVVSLQLVSVRDSELDLVHLQTRTGPWFLAMMVVAALALP